MVLLQSALDALHSFLLLSSPYLLLGFSVSAFIHCFLPMELVQKFLGRGKLSDVTLASIVGVPLPLCSCSVIPTAITLKNAGASRGAVSSFLISTPETGVDSLSLTYALIDLPMTVVRFIAAFCSAWLAGMLNFFFNKETDGKETKNDEKKQCCKKSRSSVGDTLSSVKVNSLMMRLKRSFHYSFVDLLDDMSGTLSLGLVLGATIAFVVPDDFFIGVNPELLRLSMFFVGIPIYICASATTPIAASLILKGMSPGTALVLLMVGPAMNISNILIVRKYLGNKGIIFNIIGVASTALLFSYGVDQWYESSPLHLKLSHYHDHSSEMHSWWEYAATWLMTVLIILSLLRSNVIPKIKKK